MIKAVLFDFFDVIHSDYQKLWLAKNGYSRSGDFALASDELDVGKITVNEYLQRYAAEHGSGTLDDLSSEFQRLSSLNTDLVQYIRLLRANGLRTALISNAHSDELRPLLNKHDLHELFDEIFISHEEGIAKPDPELFMRALNKLSIAPEESIFIDDNAINVAAANKMYITGIQYIDLESLKKDLDKLLNLNPTLV